MKKTLLLTKTLLLIFILTSCISEPIEEIIEEIPSTCEETYDDRIITFCDDFLANDKVNDNGIDTTKWAFQTGDGSQYGIPGWGNNEAQYYREENAFVEDGLLNIQLKNEGYGGKFYTCFKSTIGL